MVCVGDAVWCVWWMQVRMYDMAKLVADPIRATDCILCVWCVVDADICMYTCTHTHTHKYIYIYIYIYVYIYIYIYMCNYIYIYIYRLL